MQLNRIMAVVIRQYYLIRGSVSRIVPLCIWVAVDMVLWGFLTRYLNQVTSASGHLVPVLLGAVLLWDFLVRVMQGVSIAFMEDIWSRNFLNIFSTPLTIGEYITGLVITSIFTSILGLAVMIIIATAAFGLPITAYGLTAACFAFILFLFGIALGITGCAIMLRLGPSAEWFVWPIPALISPFACVFYPLATLPLWMQTISSLLPPTYVFEAMRSMVGHAVSMTAVMISALLAVAYIIIACLFFARVYRNAVRTGLIARYSAESVG